MRKSNKKQKLLAGAVGAVMIPTAEKSMRDNLASKTTINKNTIIDPNALMPKEKMIEKNSR